MPDFKTISIATAILTLTLFAMLAFFPQVIFWLFGLNADAPAYFISRRAAVIFLGLSVLFWFGRSADPSPLRRAVCLGMAVMMAALAVLGLGEFLRGFAGAGILLAVAAETAFALGFLRLWGRR